jgi:heat shock protein HslJ
MRTLRSLIPVAFVLLITACPDEAPSTPGDTPDLEGITWILDGPSIDALVDDAPSDTRVTVRFDDGQVGGTAACNQYGGTYELGDDGAISISVGSMTEMACEEPLMALESAFVGALGRVTSAGVAGDDLALEGDALTTLAFSAEQPLPLEGTAWRLDGIGSGGDTVSSVLAGTEATATFDGSGHVGGSGGCNEYGGSYTTDGAAITVSKADSTMIGCAPDVSDQEAAFFDALRRAASFQIQGSALTLLDDQGGFLLSFVAESG